MATVSLGRLVGGAYGTDEGFDLLVRLHTLGAVLDAAAHVDGPRAQHADHAGDVFGAQPAGGDEADAFHRAARVGDHLPLVFDAAAAARRVEEDGVERLHAPHRDLLAQPAVHAQHLPHAEARERPHVLGLLVAVKLYA